MRLMYLGNQHFQCIETLGVIHKLCVYGWDIEGPGKSQAKFHILKKPYFAKFYQKCGLWMTPI